MSAKDKGRRILILFIVGTFVLSSLGLSAVVIWDAVSSNDDQPATTQQEQLEELQSANEDSSVGQQLEGYDPVSNVEELQTIDLQVGDGKQAQSSSTVTAHYTGALAKNGEIFESSRDRGEPATFPLGQVIEGWKEGVSGMKEGGKRRLIIPSEMAYGEQGSPPAIGPNEPLVFDIELVSVE